MVAAIDRHIESSPSVRGGKPCLTGTRTSVGDVVLLHLRLGQSLEQIAGRFHIPLAALHAAMAFYYDHRDEIERAIESEDASIEAMRGKSLSKLQAKIEASLLCE